MAAHRQLLRKILPPVSPLLNTSSTSMVPTVVLVKNKYSEPRLEINEEEQWIVVSRFFDATRALLLLSFTRPPLTATPLCVGGNSPTQSIFSNI